MSAVEGLVGFPEPVVSLPDGSVDPFAQVAIAGNAGVTLFGGGAELRVVDGTPQLKTAWDSWLDLAFPQPWRTPDEKHAQSQAISSVLYRLYLIGRNAGRTVTFYPATTSAIAKQVKP